MNPPFRAAHGPGEPPALCPSRPDDTVHTVAEQALAPTEPPMVSILCLTYHHEAFVAQALEGFLAQETTFPFEVVLADDASGDGTLAVVEGFRARFGARLRVLTTPVNLGVTRNFRRALQACRGRYVAFCEGDDYWNGHDKLQAQVDFLEHNPGFVMCFHDAMVIDSFGHEQGIQLTGRLRRDASASELMATRPISTLTVCFRHVLKDVPAELDHAPALDLCLWSLLGQHGGGKYMGSIQPASYRVHGGGVFSTQTTRNKCLMSAQSLLCLARIWARQGRADLSDMLLLKAAIMACSRLGTAAFGWPSVAMLAQMLMRLWR
ncbi:MAG: glycosyltransferase [Rubrivivax sp.]|nr:glycosyltransferase [Rubrivivax sp.]